MMICGSCKKCNDRCLFKTVLYLCMCIFIFLYPYVSTLTLLVFAFRAFPVLANTGCIPESPRSIRDLEVCRLKR